MGIAQATPFLKNASYVEEMYFAVQRLAHKTCIKLSCVM